MIKCIEEVTRHGWRYLEIYQTRQSSRAGTHAVSSKSERGAATEQKRRWRTV